MHLCLTRQLHVCQRNGVVADPNKGEETNGSFFALGQRYIIISFFLPAIVLMPPEKEISDRINQGPLFSGNLIFLPYAEALALLSQVLAAWK